MPAIARDLSESRSGTATPSPASRRSVSATVSSRVTSSLCSSIRGSPRDNKSCTPRLTESPSVTHHQIHRTNSTSTSGLGGRISGRIITRAAGRPMAEPSAPIVSTRLRNNPPNRNATKKQRRSQTISKEILHARRASPRPIVTPMTPRIDPISVAAVSSCVIRYITIMTKSPWGMWWVKIGMVAARQANVSRKVALPLPGRRCQLAA